MGYDGALITTAQDLTTSWVDLGSEIDVAGYGQLHLWLTIDINLGANVRVRVLDKHTEDGTEEYVRPILTPSLSVVLAEPEYLEFNVDEDNKYHLAFDVDRVTAYCQVQVQAGTVGATKAQIDAAYYSRSASDY